MNRLSPLLVLLLVGCATAPANKQTTNLSPGMRRIPQVVRQAAVPVVLKESVVFSPVWYYTDGLVTPATGFGIIVSNGQAHLAIPLPDIPTNITSAHLRLEKTNDLVNGPWQDISHFDYWGTRNYLISYIYKDAVVLGPSDTNVFFRVRIQP